MTKRMRAGMIGGGVVLFVVFVLQPRMVQLRDRQRSSCATRNGGDGLGTDVCLVREYGWPGDVALEVAEGLVEAPHSASLGEAYGDLTIASEAKALHERNASLGPMARVGHYVRSWWWWLEGYEGL